MIIREAEFISSITNLSSLPEKKLPEFAFIGRSNVGKSSLINMLTGRKQLAKTSSKPGKTQTINHYLINGAWYLVDLPGYGWAGVSQEKKAGFGKIIENYVKKSPNLHCLFVLIDIRLKPQPIDLSFINWAGAQEVPITFIFTKADKLSKSKAEQNRKLFELELLKDWEESPPGIITSAEKKTGKDEVLDFIDVTLKANR
ncbi:MAG: ribosome biogenesis GTP-binding protein YihA/YsxC [Cyclobacteriaceae bacterium]|nr:YihA family ribosome biogenesis GTP-binding protein [Cyclobacteriaceae bacterium]MBX2956928.1 ribosome biogenesis GTP-binding protein YihA/YsxC [Cyclobacteriaceae bacterium]